MNEKNDGTGKEPEVQTGAPAPVVQPGHTPIELDILGKIESAEKFSMVMDRLRKLSVGQTSVADWIDQDGKPYLQWTGASKVAQLYGISYSEPTWEKETIDDDKGRYVQYRCSGMVDWKGDPRGGVPLPEIGTCSTRDSFFGRKSGEYLPLSEVDLTNVQKKTLTNFLNRGLKSRVGLSFTWEEISQLSNGRITQGNVTGVTHAKGGRAGKAEPASKDLAAKRESAWGMLLDICKGDIPTAKKELETLTSWTDRDKKVVPGKTEMSYVSEKQLRFLLPNIKKLHAKAMEQTAKEEQGATT